MPDREVTTIRDLIYYQYAKIIACSAFKVANGAEAKKLHYGFIKKTFRDLKSGGKSWSHIDREDWQLVDAEKKCNYCGSEENLQREHIVPKSLRIKSECETCEKIQSIHNQVLACGWCNSSKGTLGLYEFFHKMHPELKNFFDYIPPLVEKKYLKTIMKCHECAGTLDATDLNGDGVFSVLDIDAALRRVNNG